MGLGGLAACGLAGGGLLAKRMIDGPQYTYEIVNRFPHDGSAFTQGLVYVSGHLYEGTGLREYSELRKVNLESGRIQKRFELDDAYFGEGITIWNNQIFQLTYESERGFVYEETETGFRQIREFEYEGEGWGLTHDGARLIMSDGTDELRFLHPETQQEGARLKVRWSSGAPVRKLNELEYINGEIYANVWQEDYIVRINPQSGNVVGCLNLNGLRPPETHWNEDAVLNGIAYDGENDRLFVTGKLWPVLYEIRQIAAMF